MKEDNSHIDDFFKIQLSELAQEPELQFEILYKVISKDPIDQFFYTQLHKNEEEVPALLWDNINEKNNWIDFGLKEKLLDIEQNPPPNNKLIFFKNKNGLYKRMALLLLLFVFLTVSVRYFWVNTSDDIKDTKSISLEIENSKHKNRINSPEIDGNSNAKDDKKTIKGTEIQTLRRNKKSVKKSQQFKPIKDFSKSSINLNDKFSDVLQNRGNIEITSIDDQLSELSFLGFQFFSNNFERLVKVNHQKIAKPKLKKSIFQFGIETGYNQMQVNSINISNSKIHKDYNGQIINQLNGNHNGISRVYNMDIIIKSKLMITSGIVYSSYIKNTTFQYLYKDIPVYDSLGNILGYLQLPASQQININEPLSIKSNRVLIPLILSYPMYSKNRFVLRIGAGIRYQLNSNINLSYFDFENIKLVKTKLKTQSQIEPTMNVKALYHLTNQFKIGAQYYYTMNQQTLSLNSSDIRYKGFTHGIVLGLYFNPLIKSKK